MNSLRKTIRTLSWLSTLKTETRRRIALSPLIIGCKEGNKYYIAALILIFWKFVDEFPAILYAQFNSSSDRFVQKLSKKLSGIIHDEKSHREMWITTATSLGLPYDYLSLRREQFPKVTLISRCLSEQTTKFVIFLRIVGVEIVAEMLSTELLESEVFNAILEETAKVWFKVHVVHSGTTHEQLALDLALRDIENIEDEELKDTIWSIVLHLVDLFVDAGADAAHVAEEIELSMAA